MMRKLVLLIVISFMKISGQNRNYIDFNPIQTPEVNSLLKNIDNPISYNTGTPDISYELFDIKLDETITIPIKISYNSSGILVNERASNVGLGWSLGLPILTRNIRQLPDDSPKGFFTEATYTAENIYNIRKNVDTNPDLNCLPCKEYFEGNLDAESDDYKLILPNKIINFMVNQERSTEYPIGQIVQFPNSDYYINYLDGKWIVKDIEGTQYIFEKGDVIYSSSLYSISGENLGVDNSEFTNKNNGYITSNWVLSKIITKANKVINFEYDNIDYEDCDLINQTETLVTSEWSGLFNHSRITTTNYGKNIGNKKLIKRIYNDEFNIIFNYSTRNDIIKYGRKLDDVEIKTNNNLVKKIQFDYFYRNSFLSGNIYSCGKYENPLNITNRLFLNKLSFYEGVNRYEYQFKYNQGDLPHRYSFSRDWWGYYNGKENLSLVPKYIVGEPRLNNNTYFLYPDFHQNNNRSVNINTAKNGILTEVILPTGGKKLFMYESNRGFINLYNSQNDLIIDRPEKLLTFSSRSDTTDDIYKFYTFPIEINHNRIEHSDFKINLKTFSNKCFYGRDSLPLDGSCSIYLEVKDDIGNTILSRKLFLDNDDIVLNVNNINYINKLFINMEINSGHDNFPGNQVFNFNSDEAFIELRYKELADNSIQTPFGDIETSLGGLRIESIENYDENNILQTKRSFSYKKDGYETGISNIYLDQINTIVGAIYISSNSRFPNQIANGSNIKYGHVEETLTGKQKIKYITTYDYTNFDDLSRPLGHCYFHEQVGNAYNYSPTVPCYKHPLTDLLYEKNDNKENVKYIYENSITSKKRKTVVGIDYDTPHRYPLRRLNSISLIVDPRTIIGVNDIYYKFSNYDDPQSYKISTLQFENNNNIETVTNYSSNNPSHYQLTSQTTTFPDNTVQETTYQYAHEKGNQYLIDKNMVGIPLQTTTTKTANGVTKTLSDVETKYPVSQAEANTKTSGLPLPYEVDSKTLNNSSVNTELTYDKYDDKGNLLQYSEKGLKPTVIIWGYNKTQPIAKIEGAKYDDIKTLKVVLDAITASDTDAGQGTDTSEQSLITVLDTLRTNSSLSNYLITTYTYDPLIGVTSITPPSGIREIYKYDTANRLEKVEDVNGKILKEYQYNYKQ